MKYPAHSYLPADEAIEILTKRVASLKAGAGSYPDRARTIADAIHSLDSAIKQKEDEARA